MGENESGAVSPPSPTGLYGLLPGEFVSVTRPLDAERWAEAEERTAQLIACIQPNPPSEFRRNAVARYVRRLIMECFPHQVEIFTFGSVPLKTYLPDGDIDLTAFSMNENLKESWAHLVRDMLEWEEKNESAEFQVKEVQYIQAEVKIIKCVVEDIVVDISFNQIGGLCTLCFLEEVDHHIGQNHLFKRSIILIKAWCYNESRILGSHHGLISTYALETLVLYIFHVFNNSFSGPLEVLYRFLEFFSKFDWQKFCISLWGPVPVSSLPDVTAKPPRRDVEELRDSEVFLKECIRLYAVNPAAQEIQGQPFVSKHFNVIDPLRENNNLGRSVSKGNFFRIRSAFTLGAKKLAKLLECPKENLIHEVNQFFMNTWERHGSGRRPDAPGNDLLLSRLGDPEPYHQAETVSNSSTSKRHQNGARLGGVHGARSMPSQQNNCGTGVLSRAGKSYQPAQEVSSNQSALNDQLQQNVKPEIVVNNFHGRHLFARTRSSPELPETYLEALLQSRRSGAPEAVKCQNNYTTADNIRKKNLESETLSSNARHSADSSSVRHTLSPQSPDSTADMSSAVNSYYGDSGSVSELSIQVDDDNREWIPVPDNEIIERDLGPRHTIASFQVQRHQIHGHVPAQVSGSESTMSPAPFLLGHVMQQNGINNSGYTFDPTGPPVPFVAMLPMYNYQAGGNATSEGLATHHSEDQGVENHDPRESFDSFRGLEQSEMVASSHSTRIGSSVDPTEHKNDILIGDFINHWQNLEFGRYCQLSSVLYHAPVVVPPGYLQGRLAWDGPGRPLAYNNVVNQLMTYGPRLVPVAPVPMRPPNMYPRNGNESPRYRSGTGTYFPNPKLSPREQRPNSNMRRGNYRHDRNEHYNDDREGTWLESFSHIENS